MGAPENFAAEHHVMQLYDSEASLSQPNATASGRERAQAADGPANERLVAINTLYLIDDEESVRRSLARLLAQLRLPVRTFASAEEFLAQVNATARGCLIVDVHLPGMKGPELQHFLNAARWVLPVIAISGSLDRQVETETLRQGAKAFLCKPFDGKTLIDAIKSALDDPENSVTMRRTGSL